MADIIKTNMTEIWASAGDVQAPDAAKIRTGWVVEAVPRQWWNWFENRQDNNIAYMLQKGIPEWDAETEYQTNKSYVQRNSVVYKAAAVSINKDPALAANAALWTKAFVESTPYFEKLKSIPVQPATMVIMNSLSNADTTPYGTTGLSVLAATTPLAARTAISAQVAHSNLTALSAVTAANNVLPYFNGSASMAGTPLTAFGRDLISRADAADGRTSLGLGTAAVYNAQPNAWSPGTLMFSGAFGLGGYSLIASTSTVNPDDPNCPNGFYDIAPGTIPGFVAPIPNTWTRIIHQAHANAAGFATQIATADFANSTVGLKTQMFVRRANGTGAWSAWTRLMTEDLYPVQANQIDGVGATVGIGKLMRVGAFGIGSGLDLRATGYDQVSPALMAGSGTSQGFTTSTIIGLAGAGLGVPADVYVGLQINAPGSTSVLNSFFRIATYQERIFVQGVSSANAWGTWREVYTTANTSGLTSQVTSSVLATIQPTLDAKLNFEQVNVTYGTTDNVDPNETVQPWLLCTHANCPENRTDQYWYINTMWYGSKGTGNKMQTAVLYNISVSLPTRSYVRVRFQTGWTPWARTDLGGNAASASKWQTPRNINVFGGISGNILLDGSSDVSVSVAVVNDSHLHSISTISGLQAALDARTPSANQPNFTAAQSGLGAAVAAGQAVFSVTTQQAANGFAAGCTFLRNGYYGVNVGLSSEDNHLRIGGYSMGAVTYPLLHTGNAAALGFGGTSGAFGVNGWTRLGNGCILQWGQFTGDGFVTFPIAFPNACGAVTQMQSANLSGSVGRIALNGAPAANGFSVTGINQYPQTLPARWMAIGY